jgi:hypothetical protein
MGARRGALGHAAPRVARIGTESRYSFNVAATAGDVHQDLDGSSLRGSPSLAVLGHGAKLWAVRAVLSAAGGCNYPTRKVPPGYLDKMYATKSTMKMKKATLAAL